MKIKAISIFVLTLGFFLLVSCDDTVDPSKMQKDTVTMDKSKAKVIILSGQSNADGCSHIQYLTEEQKAKYQNGPDNVLIRLDNVLTGDKISDFCIVTLGMGNTKDLFGPEVGLAEVLSEAYPDEEIYIIKSTYSGGGLTNGVYHPGAGEAFLALKTWVRESLDILKEEGKDPEIVAFCWMQGESDAIFVSEKETKQYYKVEKSFLSKLRNSFAEDSIEGGFFFIDATINSSGVWPNHKTINNAKARLSLYSARNILLDTNAYGIVSDMEPHGGPDRAHYDADSELRLGQLFGKAIAERIKSN